MTRIFLNRYFVNFFILFETPLDSSNLLIFHQLTPQYVLYELQKFWVVRTIKINSFEPKFSLEMIIQKKLKLKIFRLRSNLVPEKSNTTQLDIRNSWACGIESIGMSLNIKINCLSVGWCLEVYEKILIKHVDRNLLSNQLIFN